MASQWASRLKHTGVRIFELSIRADVKHLVYSGLDSAYKLGGYDPHFRVGHDEGKARAAGKATFVHVIWTPF